ncbi:MAG: bacterial Ig-like domain-containing protein [Acetobacter sp.]|nr:bacterial Ig-like domain-containing protein [Bacteroides sp.]MCM1341890.1 bacterial Ig-like domain-containing protein [Acetobacter sp.]MCM1433187.1 bacterial Ig-like domain-containing protein [Clostridiales bacterium]
MKFKRIISIILAFLILLSSFSVITAFSKEQNDTVIYSENVTVKSGENVTSPIYIKNNIGLVGIKVILHYDETKLAPKSVVFTNIFDYEVKDDNIGSNRAIPGQLEIVGYNDEKSCSANGVMFYVEFETITNYVGEVSISVENDEYSTYDENYEFLKLNEEGPTISSINIIENDKTLLYSDKVKGNYNDIMTIPIKIKNNKGLFKFTFNFKYDTTQIELISCEKVVWPGWFGGYFDEENNQYVCLGENGTNSKDVVEDGELFNIKFKVITKDEVNSVIKISGEEGMVVSLHGVDRMPGFENIEIILNHTPIVTDLVLKSKPSKLTYELFEEFDGNGMVIEATKDDGLVETITDYTVTGFETNSVGTKTVTVSYGDKSVSFDIDVVHNHTWSEWQTVSSPNCLDKGSEKRVCSVCKETEMRDVDPLGHNWDEDFTVDIEPTCETAGSKSIHCSRCDVIKDVTSIEPIGHDYESSITKKPTCTENGIKTFVCKNDASHTYTELVEKLGHNYVGSITKQPTCEENGIKTFVCSNDSTHTYTEDIQPIGHSFELTKTIKPTCTDDGKEIYTCKNDLSHTKEVVLKATGHTSSDWIIDKTPNYLENGSRHKECTVCKTVLGTESISMLDDITAPEIEIKVKDNSFKSFINNISFGLFFKETVDITITAQDAESGIEKIEYIKTNTQISESDIALQTEWILGNSLTVSEDEEFIIYVKATDKQGNISYAGTDGLVVDKTVPVINGIVDNAVYCQPVSFTVSDKYIEKVIVNGIEALTDSGEYTLPSANSQYKIVAVDKAGNETVYSVTVNDSHTYGDWVIDTPADCTHSGAKHRICSICGYEQSEVISELGHNYSDAFTVDVEPTCTTEGEKSKHCLRCDDRTDITVVNALGHSFGEWTTIISPDCTNSGSKHRVCKVCGFVENESVNPNGHDWNKDYTIDVPATCIDEGSKSIHCVNCDVIKDSQVIPATGHNFGEYKVVESATCTETGLEESKCSKCDYSETRVISALGHDYSNEFTVDKAATCTESGEKSKHCSRCDSKADVTVIPPTGHSYGDWTVVTVPTCTEKGIQQRVCTVCDAVETGVISETGHSWDNDYAVDVEPDCTTEGSKSIHCENCDETKDAVVIPPIGHQGGIANCHSGAVCEVCGTEYGEIDLSNHDGDIEIKGYIASTVDNPGYTGDKYCKSCGTILESGTQIDKLSPETTEPTKPADTTQPEENTIDVTEKPSVTTNSTEEPTDKTETTTQKSETTTVDSTESVKKNTSKTSPATGSMTALPVALSTAFTFGLFCLAKKKKED